MQLSCFRQDLMNKSRSFSVQSRLRVHTVHLVTCCQLKIFKIMASQKSSTDLWTQDITDSELNDGWIYEDACTRLCLPPWKNILENPNIRPTKKSSNSSTATFYRLRWGLQSYSIWKHQGTTQPIPFHGDLHRTRLLRLTTG